VIVATNAFGMGIDKPNVRFVVHMDIPSDPESYFQEAGRAGRDGTKSYGILLWNEQDLLELDNRVDSKYPEFETIKSVYDKLGNYHSLAFGAGKNSTYAFSLNDFCGKFNFKGIEVHSSLRLLQRGGWLSLSDGYSNPSKVKILAGKQDLYDFQVRNPLVDPLIKLLLRTYSGVFEIESGINEDTLAKRLHSTKAQVRKDLLMLSQQGVLSYDPSSDLPQITYLEERVKPEGIHLDKAIYKDRKLLDLERALFMRMYVVHNDLCRSQALLKYFEDEAEPCGLCDVCLEKKRQDKHLGERSHLEYQILDKLSQGAISPKELVNKIGTESSDDILDIVRWMMDAGEIEVLSDDTLMVVKKV
jgi:ATP-dependent DNA helicase RecQ